MSLLRWVARRSFLTKLLACACLTLVLIPPANSQEEASKLTVDVRNTFVWGEDAPAGAISSALRDPLTGRELRRLKHNGIEVTSRIGFEKLHAEDVAEFIIYSSTIVNNTRSELQVEFGGVAIDGHLVSPLLVDSNRKGVKEIHSNGKKGTVEIRNLRCLGTGYLSSESFFNQKGKGVPPRILVEPQSSRTVSAIVKDPRIYPILCTAEGCFPKGMIRYSILVDSREYIFSWSGDSLMNCGRR